MVREYMFLLCIHCVKIIIGSELIEFGDLLVISGSVKVRSSSPDGEGI
jgi:hypothetical protein